MEDEVINNEKTNTILTTPTYYNGVRYRKYCNNCGQSNHIAKVCNNPILSYGYILFRINTFHKHKTTKLNKIISDLLETLNSEYKSSGKLTKSNLNNLYIDNELLDRVVTDKYEYITDLSKNEELVSAIEFLIVQRKHSYALIDFVKGNYTSNPYTLFTNMTQNEYNLISSGNFDIIYKSVFGNDDKHREEYINSYNKYKQINFDNYNHVQHKYAYNEWGFPKGKKNYKEYSNMCARRELYEETNICYTEFIDCKLTTPYTENIIGTNGIQYKYVYYIGYYANFDDISLSPNIKYEIDDIKWCDINEIFELIRPFHLERKKIIIKLILNILSVLYK